VFAEPIVLARAPQRQAKRSRTRGGGHRWRPGRGRQRGRCATRGTPRVRLLAERRLAEPRRSRASRHEPGQAIRERATTQRPIASRPVVEDGSRRGMLCDTRGRRHRLGRTTPGPARASCPRDASDPAAEYPLPTVSGSRRQRRGFRCDRRRDHRALARAWGAGDRLAGPPRAGARGTHGSASRRPRRRARQVIAWTRTKPATLVVGVGRPACAGCGFANELRCRTRGRIGPPPRPATASAIGGDALPPRCRGRPW
jgi:hypothetical protein